jgi:hypothetical protein
VRAFSEIFQYVVQLCEERAPPRNNACDIAHSER